MNFRKSPAALAGERKKARWKRILAYGLAAMVMVGMPGCGKKEQAAYTQASPLTEREMEERGHEERLKEYGGENVAAYRNADGTTTLYVYAAPIEGADTALRDGGQGENGYFADGTFTRKTLPSRLGEEKGISVVDGNGGYLTLLSAQGEFEGVKTTRKTIFGREKEAVCYEDVFGEGVDLYCYPTTLGINTEIVLPKYEGTNTFRLKVRLPRVVPDTGSPDYILFKTPLESGEVKSLIYTPLAVDKKGNWCYANQVRLVEKDAATGTYTVEFTVDEAFLTSKDTKYPVVLNQSLHLHKSKQPDTSAYSGTGDEAGHYLSPYMLLGDSTVKGEGWTYVRFETLANLSIDYKQIQSAAYVFHNLMELPKEAVVSAYPVNADWCSINTRWFNRPASEEKPVNQVVVKKPGDYRLDMTPLIKEMVKNKADPTAKYSIQNSFLIRCDTPGSSLLLASGDSCLYSPVLEIVLAGAGPG